MRKRERETKREREREREREEREREREREEPMCYVKRKFPRPNHSVGDKKQRS